MGRLFWQEHQRFFELYAWSIQAQPTAIFQLRLWAWMNNNQGLVTPGATITQTQKKSPRGRPVTRWQTTLSQCTADRSRNRMS